MTLHIHVHNQDSPDLKALRAEYDDLRSKQAVLERKMERVDREIDKANPKGGLHARVDELNQLRRESYPISRRIQKIRDLLLGHS